jgi:glucan phosphorylase
MKIEEKEKAKENIIELFKVTKGVTVGYVCRKADISRKTFYEWRKEDEEFKKKTDELREEKKKDMDDFAERVLYKKIAEGDNACLIFYLKTRHPDYNRNTLEISDSKDINEQRDKINSLLKIIRGKNAKAETGESK